MFDYIVRIKIYYVTLINKSNLNSTMWPLDGENVSHVATYSSRDTITATENLHNGPRMRNSH